MRAAASVCGRFPRCSCLKGWLAVVTLRVRGGRDRNSVTKKAPPLSLLLLPRASWKSIRTEPPARGEDVTVPAGGKSWKKGRPRAVPSSLWK